MTKRAVFIGRFSPFHKGHLAIMKKKIDQGKPLLILVRNTHYDIYPAPLRKRMIEAAMSKLKADAKILIIDDIESVNFGRGVGYDVNEINVDDDIKKISATQIRNMIKENDDSWKEFIPKGADRILYNYLGGKGVVAWFTGLPKAGKSTIANLVNYKLEQQGIKGQIIDSKFLRSTISKDLGFSKEDRNTNIERASFLSELLSRNGGIVLSTFISPYEEEREKIRKRIEKNANFVLVHVDASVKICKKRDDEGLYEKAEKGIIENFTGVSDPYEKPKNPELHLDTENNSAEECAEVVVKYIFSLLQ